MDTSFIEPTIASILIVIFGIYSTIRFIRALYGKTTWPFGNPSIPPINQGTCNQDQEKQEMESRCEQPTNPASLESLLCVSEDTKKKVEETRQRSLPSEEERETMGITT